MDVQGLLAPDAEPHLGRSRARVLDLLRAAASPLGVQQVAGQAGLHPNTARFHLDALVASGLADRAAEKRTRPGRPGMAYRAADSPGTTGRRSYRLLAQMLTSLIAGVLPDPAEAATQAGREWGRYVTDQPPPYGRPDAAEAVGKLTATMAEFGFAPQAVPAGNDYELRLRQCPFREVAEHHQDVVCSLHLGLMQGALAELQAPVTADDLRPFVEPALCVAHLAVQPGPDSRPQVRGPKDS